MRRRAQLWSRRLYRRSSIRGSSWPGFRLSRRSASSASSRLLRSPEPLLSLLPGLAPREDAAEPEPAGPSRRLHSEATGAAWEKSAPHNGVPQGMDVEVKRHRCRRETFEGDVEARFDQHGRALRRRVQTRAARTPTESSEISW